MGLELGAKSKQTPENLHFVGRHFSELEYDFCLVGEAWAQIRFKPLNIFCEEHDLPAMARLLNG